MTMELRSGWWIRRPQGLSLQVMILALDCQVVVEVHKLWDRLSSLILYNWNLLEAEEDGGN